MNKIYITGDVHGDIDFGKLTTSRFPEQKQLTKDDYLIVLGDFGAVWYGDRRDKYMLDWYEDKPFTTLFVPGNHENYDLLEAMPREEWHGGIVTNVRPSVKMLRRGYVFDINDKKFLAMGGAKSHDMQYRKKGVSWWEQEMPSDEEYDLCMKNIASEDNRVDIVLSHCAPTRIFYQSGFLRYCEPDKLTNFFDKDVLDVLSFDMWLFGHYHKDFCNYDMTMWGVYDNVWDLDDLYEQFMKGRYEDA